MDSSIVRARRRIVRFERHMKREATVRDVTDIEAIFSRQQLALIVDES
jgi:hypothetical protein